MTKRSIRELERQCKKEPDNLVARLLLAAAYREAGRTAEAVPLYRSVASTYQTQGRRTQAVAVLRSLLEIDPQDQGSRSLLDAIDREGTPSMPPPFQPPSSATPDLGTPPPETQPDADRPPTIPSLDKLRPSATARKHARVLDQDVVLRELTPVRPPGVPATPIRPTPTPEPDTPVTSPPRLAQKIAGMSAAAAERAARLTPGRSSSGFYTPTPLPPPVPFHEADGTDDLERLSARDLLSSRDLDAGDDAKTRIASDRGASPKLRPGTPDPTFDPSSLDNEVTDPRAGERLAQTGERTSPNVDIAAELETRPVRRLSEAEVEAARQPPPGHTERHGRLESADLDVATNPDAQPAGRRADTGTPTPRMEPSHPVEDDEPTRYTGESPAARPGDVTRPSSDFDVATGIRGRSAPPSAQRPPTTTRQVQPRPRPPTRPRALTPPPVDDAEPTRIAPEVRPRPQLARLEDVPITRDTAPMPPPAHIVDHGAAPPDHGDEQTDVRDEPPVRASEPGRHRSRTFTASFAPTLEEMDPDGAAIDAPLDMFSMLPAEALNELGRRITLRRFAPGEIIIREGDPGDACYIIVDGEVRVLKNDPLQPDAGAVEVARLGNRAMFGEFALLADRRRHATVQATSHCDLYEIPRQLLRELAASYPDVGPLLETFYRQRLLATLLRTAPFFKPLPEEQRAQLLARFVPIRAESGESIVREGQPAGGLYLIVIGAVEITRRLGKHRSVILATLREGAYFGEMSLLSGEPTSATVVAAGPVELALLPPRDFYEVVSTHPQLWASIRREARTRALENARLLAGETGTV